MMKSKLYLNYIYEVYVVNYVFYRSEDLSSEASLFLGGSRMEHLLQALHHENDSGSFFKKYVDRSGSKVLYT